MKEKIKDLIKKMFMTKEVEGEPLDLSPGIKIKRTVEVGGEYTFNEIAENIIKQQEAMR
jgi:hypothetical protein